MTLIEHTVRKSWLVLMILLIGLTACAPAQGSACPALKIGVLFASDDPEGKSELDAGYQAALKEVNSKGIGNGCKVQFVYPKNQKTTAADAAKDLQDLVDQGSLVVLSAQTNEVSKRIAKVSNYLSIPVILPIDTGDETLTAVDNSWFVRINPMGSSYSESAINFLKAAPMTSNPRIAILFEQSEFGESSAVNAGKSALANNLPIGLYHRFSPYLSDFKEISDLLTKTDPSVNVIYLISTQPKQVSQLLNSLAKLKTASGSIMTFDYIIGLGTAFTSQEFSVAHSDGSNAAPANLIINVPWSADASRKDQTQCAQAVVPDAGPGGIQSPVLRNVQGYVSVHLAASAINQVIQKKNWKINEKTVTDWRELLRTPDAVSLFRSDLIRAIRSTRTCQIGSQVWPVNFDKNGQNMTPPLLVSMKDGKWSLLEAK